MEEYLRACCDVLYVVMIFLFIGFWILLFFRSSISYIFMKLANVAALLPGFS
jgi:hypothetical protein